MFDRSAVGADGAQQFGKRPRAVVELGDQPHPVGLYLDDEVIQAPEGARAADELLNIAVEPDAVTATAGAGDEIRPEFGDGDDLSGCDDRNAVAELPGLLEQVRAEHRGLALIDDQRPDERANVASVNRIDGARRFVQQQHRRVCGARAIAKRCRIPEE